jgi:hypothetical protein
MFKKACFLILIVLLFSQVYSVRLVEPISKEINKDSFVGAVVGGQTLELIVSKELGKFDSLELTNLLPKEFGVKVEDYLESIKIFIMVPNSAPQSDYSLKFKLIGRTTEEVSVYFTVNNSLLDVSFLNYSDNVFVKEKAIYELLLINNSYADAKFDIKPNLPWYWLNNKQNISVVVPKKTNLKTQIEVYPQVQGQHNFTSTVFLQDIKVQKDFTLSVVAKPTFKSKFSSPLNGLPFYSISLLPSYIFNALLFNLN